MKKRLILAALLSVGVLVGCGNFGSSSEPSSQPSSSEVSSETPSSEEASSEEISSEEASSEEASSEEASSEEVSSEETSSEPVSSEETTVTGWGTQADPLTVEEAVAAMKNFADDEFSTETGYLTGKVINKSYSTQYSNWTFELECPTGVSYTSKVYGALLGTGVNEPNVGDTIVAYGYFEKYVSSSSGAVCYEVAYHKDTKTSPTIVSVIPGEGSGSNDNTSSETPTINYGTKESPLTPAQVATIVSGFENNQPSEQKGYVTGVVTGDVSYNETHSSYSFYLEAGSLSFQVYSAKLGSNVTAPTTGSTVIVNGYFTTYNSKVQVAYINGYGNPEIVSVVGGNTTPDLPSSSENTSSEPSSQEPAPEGSVVASKTLADLGWSNGVLYPELKLDSVVTVTATGTPVGNYSLNTGKYYNTGKGWRFYQNEKPEFKISVASGYELVSVKITYSVDKTGVLTLNGNNVDSKAVVTASGSSITFSVGNTGTATNGQVRVSAIEVTYAAV